MDLDEGGEARLDGEGVIVAELGIVEDGDDEEDGVGAPLDGLEDLAFVDDEVLAQEGQGDGGADLAEVIEGPLEEGLVGEDGQAAGAGFLVGLGDADGVEVGADDAGGGGGLLDLGDEGDLAGAGVLEGGEEVAGFAALEDGVAEVPGGEGPAGQAGHLGAFPGDDGVEDVGHGGGQGVGAGFRRPRP